MSANLKSGNGHSAYDVVVVGAGPAGSMAAKYAAQGGARTLLLEEHPRVGCPVHCTGLISQAGVVESELPDIGEVASATLRGATMFAPDGSRLHVDGREAKAVAVDRTRFDPALAAAAVEQRAELWEGARGVHLESLNGASGPWRVHVQRDGEMRRVEAPVVVCCDGLKGTLARQAGFGWPRKMLPAAQIEGRFESLEPGFVEMYFGREVAPGFFAWAVPLDDGYARLGLCAEERPAYHLERFLTRHPGVSRRFRGDPRASFVYGIPLGLLRETVRGGVMVAGNAAGQVKPTSGGGIYTGMACGKMAGRAAARAIAEEDLSLLAGYEREWRRRFASELRMGMVLHELLGRLKDEDLARLFRYFNTPEILDLIVAHGDIDFPSKLVSEVLRRRPAELRDILSVLLRDKNFGSLRSPKFL